MKKYIVLVLVLLIAYMVVGCDQKNTQTPSDEEAISTATLLGPGESYVYEIEDGYFSTYIGGKVITEDKIGSKIEDVSVMAGWKNNTDGTQLSQEKLRGEVYLIEGISKDVAVALKFIDKGEALTTTHYYVIVNPIADLSTVEDYVIAPNFPNNIGDE